MFSTSFWESDFISQHGFETLVTRMRAGRHTCRELEDFLKQRAKAEEDFAKALLKIAKVERCSDETGTLKSSIDCLRHESEIEASIHLTHAQQLTEEANKLTEFREKQREERKRHEEMVHKSHKTKVDNYRRMANCKSSYETKYKSAEKADSDLEKIKFGNKTKEIEKARKQSVQSRQAAQKADEDYKNSIAQLEQTRQCWERDHRTGCEIFQKLEEERIQCLRNVLWVFSNLGSDLFVKSDDSRENIRNSLEKCDEANDIRDFINRKATGSTPLAPITYVSLRGNSTNHAVNMISNNIRPVAAESDNFSSGYASIDHGSMTYIALYDYAPRTDQEVELNVDDRVVVSRKDDDGWWKGRNKRTGREGLFPANYVQQE